jgi:hypothetical protein
MKYKLSVLIVTLAIFLGYSILWETQEGRLFAAKWLVVSGTFILTFKE